MDTVLDIIRMKVDVGELPKSRYVRSWYGKGNGRPCQACDVPIGRDEIEVETDFDLQPTVRFHATCFSAWCATTQNENGGSADRRRY